MFQGFDNGFPSFVARQTHPGDRLGLPGRVPPSWGGGELVSTLLIEHLSEH
jgi:hypothetical protein